MEPGRQDRGARQMDRWQAMRVFVKVAETESFARAARELHLSAPAVTRLVAGLEALVGARLHFIETLSNALPDRIAVLDRSSRFLHQSRLSPCAVVLNCLIPYFPVSVVFFVADLLEFLDSLVDVLSTVV